ncbi:aspartyl/asparaginyl beta-hydroxylase domain-containing protein [Brevundimonas lenta]|uniref:Aspartyl/asparaginy/proline hydroxylase domain-containing protein n=1 Tax=Brevundimonas lenta TaxID=424796 RepID=A0A7W6JBY6_9CAUL|nr:aspartyl/asparaginyl beta-hydroxylase domain-containing protein [Brevundimonas lenta]MBB4082299.1 hypothetical protein [Brevundimonas lenta]
MIDRLRLPFAFDPVALQADLAVLSAEGWLPHFNRGSYDGDWSGLVLRGPAWGDGLYPNGADVEDKPLLAICPAFRAVMAAFRCPLQAVRLLRLGPGAVIREHRDYDLDHRHGDVRIHVPVRTNPYVAFHVRNRRVDMAEGETWYLDLSQPHRVVNAGATDRIHLVIDATVNDWLRDLIPFDAPDPFRHTPPADLNPDAATAALERFRLLVDARPDLHAVLRDIADRDLFAEETIRLGAEHGFLFTGREVAEASARERRRWNDRWMA